MNNCYLCDAPLTEQNQSAEHIIPNSIGGRLKSKSLICKPCNNDTGLIFDNAFAEFGNILAIKHNINQKMSISKEIQAKDLSTGESLLVMPGYKLKYKNPKSKIDDAIISVAHYDKKRAIQEIKKLAKQIDGKEINEKDIKFSVIEDNTEKQFIIDMSLEPSLLLRSVSKTIVNLFLYKTRDYNNCQPLINFLRENIDNRFCWFLDLGISKIQHNRSPYHIIIIKGERKSKMLYAYFEIFGEIGFLTLLNGQYQGLDQQINYTFDPVNNIEIESDYDFRLKAGDIIHHLMVKPESEMVKCCHH